MNFSDLKLTGIVPMVVREASGTCSRWQRKKIIRGISIITFYLLTNKSFSCLSIKLIILSITTTRICVHIKIYFVVNLSRSVLSNNNAWRFNVKTFHWTVAINWSVCHSCSSTKQRVVVSLENLKNESSHHWCHFHCDSPWWPLCRIWKSEKSQISLKKPLLLSNDK